MLEPTALDTQLDAQLDDRLRVLIVGAGVAGLTLAQLLRTEGLHPVVIDRAPDAGHPGYMLALMPLVDRALDDLGVHEEYRRRSTPLDRFIFRGHRGPVLRSDPLGEVLLPYGEYRGLDRGALVEVLTADGCPVTFGTTLSSFRHKDGVSTVMFADRDGHPLGEGAFDLVVGADGVHSRMRGLLTAGLDPAPHPDPDPAKRTTGPTRTDAARATNLADAVDTGWSGWVVWADDHGDTSSAEELWGNGFFLGVYPVQGRVGAILCRPDTEPDLSRVIALARRSAHGIGPRLSGALEALEQTPDPYLGRLDDARTAHWVVPGAALLGDAAAGFLPTAGIGAGMAMESAWMLARMMRGAEASELPAVLAAWERVEKPRVETAQANSRTLAKLMFRRGAAAAWMREAAVRMMSIRRALTPILSLVADQPDPDLLATSAQAAR